MAIDGKDIYQNIAGVLAASIWIFILRDTPLIINPQVGLTIGIVWILFLYNPFKTKTQDQKHHFLMSIIISLIIATYLTLQFNFATIDQLQSFQFFGTLAWIAGIFFGLLGAITFDQKNIDNPLNRFIIRKR